MKSKGKKIRAGIWWIFILMVFGVFLFLILGEVLLPKEQSLESERCEIFEAEWKRMLPDGTSVSVEVPGTCEADRLESVSIETVLPGELGDDTWLCMQSSWQDMEVFVDQVLRKRYTTEGSKPFGNLSVGAYVFLKLEQEDAGKILRITTVTDSSYAGVMNTVYIGNRTGILKHLVKQYGFKLVLAVFLMILSFLSILGSMVLRRFYKKEILLEYLSWGIFLCSVWMISNSGIRQFLFPNVSVIANVAFFAAMLMPVPFLIYMDGVQEHRYRKGYIVIEFLALINFVVCTLLQVINQVEFMDNMVMILAVLFVSFLYIIFTMCKDIRKRRIRKYRLTALGVLFMSLMSAGEVVIIYRKLDVYSGTILCAGLIFLMFIAITDTVQKLFYMEREKQRAVLANESKGKFLANMSHEIRTPINTVIGMNEMILRENQDAAIQQYAENINNASKALLSLVNDVLDFSKMESGSFELTNSPYYLSSLLNDTIHVLKARVEKKNLEVRLNVDEGLPSVLVGDEVRIRKVLNHLFSNSVKFTREGMITFSAQGEWSDDGSFCLSFSVADTGIGIQKEDLGKLYDSFTRLDEDKNYGIEGSGLGLNLTKQLVDQMHGDIRVNSVYGKGSLFTVRIPQEIADPEPIGDLQKAYEREQQEGEQIRAFLYAPEAVVLAVDDNEMNLAVVRGLLKRTGIQLDTVTGGKECLIYTRRRKYDLIFMDHMMPEPDGIETLHLLRAETDNPNVDTKVIALTANAVAGSREEYLREGFDDYLSKPVVAEKLENMLKKYLPRELVHVKLEDRTETTQAVTEEATEALQAEPELIDQKAGLPYCGNDMEMYREILMAYYEQGKEYEQKLPVFYEQKDWKSYAIIAHAVKSTSLTIGAVTVSEQAKRQELAAKEGHLETLEEYWESFYEDYRKALKEAARILDIEKQPGEEEQLSQKESSGSGEDAVESPENAADMDASAEEFDRNAYRKECQVLLEQIQGYEMSEALEQIEKLLSIKSEEVLQQVKTAVHDFDYDSAERYLQEWMKEQEMEQ